MIFGSVCSGIESASVAWRPLGWRAAFLSEIEKFPRAVLAHHYPEVPLHGDFTTIQSGDYGSISLLVGGTPCQDFSVAGLRAGIAGDQGRLTIEFVKLLERLQPRWFVWENVPGVLAADDGDAFATFLWLLGKCGYGYAYRVLDAQYFGVPQRRRRVFVVGYFGNWRPPAAVLFESQSLRWNPPPSRAAGQGVAPTIASRPLGGGGLGTDFDCDGGLTVETLRQHPRPGSNTVGAIIAADLRNGAVAEVAQTMQSSGTAKMGLSVNAVPHLITHTLRGDGFDASEDGTGRGTPIIPILEVGARTGKSTDDLRAGSGIGNPGDPMFTLQSGKQHAMAIPIHSDASRANSGALTPSPDAEGRIRLRDPGLGIGKSGDPMFSLTATAPHAIAFDLRGREGGATAGSLAVVRRLTPRECERLPGFPDDYTLIEYRGKPAADGPRHKALGNSMAVPVMRWIGERIELVEGLLK